MTRVLITGAGGFVGSHVLEHLLASTTWQVVATDSFRHKGKVDRITQVLEHHPHWRPRVTVFTHDLAAPFTAQTIARMGAVDYVLAMASESHVDRSIADPVPFVRNNVNVALSTLEFCREVAPKAVLWVSTDEVYGPEPVVLAPGQQAPVPCPHPEWAPILPSNPYAGSKAAQEAIAISYWRTYGVPVVLTNCYDTQTRVMTEHGFKGHDELRAGDRVWTLDTGENLVLETVQRTVRMPGSGTMVRVRSTGVDQLVTPNHRMMIRRPVGNPRRWQPIEECSAESLLTMRGRVRIPRTGPWQGETSPVFRPYEHIAHQGSRGTPGGGRGWGFKGLPQEMATEWVAALFGWFVSEGCTSSTTVRIGAGSAQQVETVSELLRGLDGDSYINGGSVCVANGDLAELLNLAGRGAENKEIPQFIRDLDPKYLRVFLEAAVAGDGTWYGSSPVYYTKSWTLAQQMCEVGMKLGYAARVSERETWNPAKTVKSRSWIVRLSGSAGDIEQRNVTAEDYDGEVWCLSVPSGRVFVERNGVISLSGQTMNIYGERQDPEKFLPMLIREIAGGREVPIHGVPGDIGTRHYLHARNAADAWLHILRELPPASFAAGAARPDRYNVAGPDRLSNLELASQVAGLVGRQLRYRLVDFHSARPGHDPHYGLDGSKLAAAGWKPPVRFHESLARTVRWSMDHPEWLAG